MSNNMLPTWGFALPGLDVQVFQQLRFVQQRLRRTNHHSALKIFLTSAKFQAVVSQADVFQLPRQRKALNR